MGQMSLAPVEFLSHLCSIRSAPALPPSVPRFPRVATCERLKNTHLVGKEKKQVQFPKFLGEADALASERGALARAVKLDHWYDRLTLHNHTG